ncbi:MAG: hypothetical protein AAF512_21535, partial [Pseudomonadota bacterium]
AVYMNEHYDFSIIMVAWPPLMAELKERKAAFEAAGLEVFVQAFMGMHEDKMYPQSYTDEDKALLRQVFYSRHDYEFLVEHKRPGLCNAGHLSFHVDEMGIVTPCGEGQYNYILGDLSKSPELNLADGPLPCPFQTCGCDTENMNTVIFHNHYKRDGINQHTYKYRFLEEAKENPALGEWRISY